MGCRSGVSGLGMLAGTVLKIINKAALISLLVWILFSCRIDPPVVLEVPETLRAAAWEEAQRYLGMPYEWGGSDFPKGIDCSGLVINVYKKVLYGTGCRLPFPDATAFGMYQYYTIPVADPDKGDLIFMGDEGSTEITHVAIFEKIELGSVYFIDSTLNNELSIDGVTYRSCPADHP